jgi:hypothetical protein
MSKRTSIIGGVAGIVILLVAIGIFMTREDAQQQANVSQITPKEPQEPLPVKPQAYQEFVKSGRSEVCTFATNLDNTVTTGTVYAAYGKIRTDFAITLPKGTAHQHLLVDSYIAYLWSNTSSSGIKFTVEEADENGLGTIFGQSGPNFQCKEQPVDIKVFELPADVAFTDISGLNDETP